MRELSLHILDLVQNAIEAGAVKVKLEIVEDKKKDIFLIRVTDDGRGMDEIMRKKVLDPFVTTRTTRKIGLGLPLIDMSTKHCGGYLKIDSEPGRGTIIEAMYLFSHIDRPPLGNIIETIKSILIANPDLDFCYSHSVDEHSFRMFTREIVEILGDVPLTHPDVLDWLHEYVKGNISNLYGGAENENG